MLLAGCGGTQSTGEFGDVPIVLGDTPTADEAGVYLATERGYDTAEGVTFNARAARSKLPSRTTAARALRAA